MPRDTPLPSPQRPPITVPLRHHRRKSCEGSGRREGFVPCPGLDALLIFGQPQVACEDRGEGEQAAQIERPARPAPRQAGRLLCRVTQVSSPYALPSDAKTNGGHHLSRLHC
ncbi:hypothetical protein E2C01_043778 [Portunus trituberculatus]|uniref:Uncharacterized protein n=1 Tax=Portunus trituberculatus TaxID=210409 RepID=A0A5B7FTU7_PORTR|nr:hypothetical protein [Portunus trituberculatus]